MSELEDRINSILGDPEQMEKISGLARSLMGGQDSAEMSKELPSELPFDPKLLSRLSSVMNSGAGQFREQALLEAMLPYLSDKRRNKMDRALKLAKLAKLARIAMDEMGGGSGNEPL